MDRKLKGLKVDLHLHTCDGISESYINYNAFRLIDVAMEMGHKVLSITNHDTVTYNDYLKDYARERGILLIPGVEITLKGGHVLAYNVNDPLNSINDLSDIERIKDRDNLFIAPHPFFPGSVSLGRHFIKWQSIFDAIELCHFYTDSINFNRKAIDMAEKFNLPLVGTSDSHLLRQLNTTYSFIYAEKDTEAIFDAIRNRAVKVVTSPLSTAEAGMILQEMFAKKYMKKFGTACFYLLSLLSRG